MENVEYCVYQLFTRNSERGAQEFLASLQHRDGATELKFDGLAMYIQIVITDVVVGMLQQRMTGKLEIE